MYSTLPKSKLPRAAATHCELHCEGSCAIGEDLLDGARLVENEQEHIWKINNGERFVTCAIKGKRGSTMLSVQGAAARRAAVGELPLIAAFAQVPKAGVATHRAQRVFVHGQNRQNGLRDHVPTPPI